jgi:hypothetical protein
MVPSSGTGRSAVGTQARRGRRLLRLCLGFCAEVGRSARAPCPHRRFPGIRSGDSTAFGGLATRALRRMDVPRRTGSLGAPRQKINVAIRLRDRPSRSSAGGDAGRVAERNRLVVRQQACEDWRFPFERSNRLGTEASVDLPRGFRDASGVSRSVVGDRCVVVSLVRIVTPPALAEGGLTGPANPPGRAHAPLVRATVDPTTLAVTPSPRAYGTCRRQRLPT